MATALLMSGVQLAPPASADAPPANDAFANRIAISPDQVVSFDNLGATYEPGADLNALQAACGPDASFPDGFQVPSIWYDVTPTTSGRMKVLFPQSDFDPVAVVVTGDPGSFVGAACVFSSFDVVAGTTYHVAVASFSGDAGGSGQLVVATAPPPPTIAVTVDGTGTVDRSTDTVSVGGTVTCSSADNASIIGQLRQVVGRYYINGFLEADLGTCDGAAHHWTGTVAGATGQFGKGSATLLSPDATACNAFDCTDLAVPSTQLRLGASRGSKPTPPPPGDGSFSLSVDPKGTINRTTNVATIGGTVSCTGGGAPFLGGVLRQISGRMFVDGFAFASLGTCDGTTQRWSADVIGQTGLYRSGGAIISDGFAGACDDSFNCTGVPVNVRIQLHGAGKPSPFGAPPPGPGSEALLVSVDRTGSLDSASNTATISGSATCTGDALASISITVRQLAGRIFIDGGNFADLVPCDGIPHQWSVEVEGSTGRYAGGTAEAFGDASACGLTDCVDTPISANVRLRKA